MSEKQYLSALKGLLQNGNFRTGRNGNTYSNFDMNITYQDVSWHFPIFQSKFVHFKSIVVELLWMIKGFTNIDYLHKHGVSIWDEWADEDGNLGPVYGAQWRRWKTGGYDEHGTYGEGEPIRYIDQLATLIKNIKADPYSRRHIISAWNVGELDDMELPPCHAFMQFYVKENKLHLKLTQRSADMFLGVPFNVASYSLLLILVARETGLEVGDFHHSLGDYHIYEDHVDAVKRQLANGHTLYEFLTGKAEPQVLIKSPKGIFDLEPEDIALEFYQHMGVIKAPVSK